MAGLRHNKRKNVGIVNDIIAREMASAVIDGDKVGGRRVMGLARRLFGPGTALGRELELFDAVRSTRGMSREAARKMLSEVSNRARECAGEDLAREREVMPRVVASVLGAKAVDRHRLSDYRLLASIQVFLDNARGTRTISEAADLLRVEDALVGYMVSSETDTRQAVSEEVDTLACALAARKFKERYGSLGERAFSLLEKFALSSLTGDIGVVRQQMELDRREIVETIDRYSLLQEARGDAEMSSRISQARERLGDMGMDLVNEEKVGDLVMYWQLAAEMRSDG